MSEAHALSPATRDALECRVLGIGWFYRPDSVMTSGIVGESITNYLEKTAEHRQIVSEIISMGICG